MLATARFLLLFLANWLLFTGKKAFSRFCTILTPWVSLCLDYTWLFREPHLLSHRIITASLSLCIMLRKYRFSKPTDADSKQDHTYLNLTFRYLYNRTGTRCPAWGKARPSALPGKEQRLDAERPAEGPPVWPAAARAPSLSPILPLPHCLSSAF